MKIDQPQDEQLAKMIELEEKHLESLEQIRNLLSNGQNAVLGLLLYILETSNKVPPRDVSIPVGKTHDEYSKFGRTR